MKAEWDLLGRRRAHMECMILQSNMFPFLNMKNEMGPSRELTVGLI